MTSGKSRLRVALSARRTRWILLVLYALLVLGLVGFSGGGAEYWMYAALLALAAAQPVFVFGQGNRDLLKPVHRRRILLPILIGSFMMAIPVMGAWGAIEEVGHAHSGIFYGRWGAWTLLALGVVWLAWGTLFYVHVRRMNRVDAVRRMEQAIFAGSLFSLLVTIPSHLHVTRKPGCFAGLSTAFGISAGVVVMLWSFGPAILLLFLHEWRNEELRRNGAGKVRRREPEPE